MKVYPFKAKMSMLKYDNADSLFIYRRVNFHCNYQTFSSFVVLLTQQCYFHSDTRVLVLSSLKAIYADQELHTLKAQTGLKNFTELQW